MRGVFYEEVSQVNIGRMDKLPDHHRNFGGLVFWEIIHHVMIINLDSKAAF